MEIQILNTTLRAIIKSLNCIKGKWAITGGANHYIRGIIPYINDLDIITSAETGRKIADQLDAYLVKDYIYTESEKIRSFFGMFEVNQLPIDLMGDPVNLVDSTWVSNPYWIDNIEFFNFSGIDVPLTTLDYEMYIYKILGNTERENVLVSYINN